MWGDRVKDEGIDWIRGRLSSAEWQMRRWLIHNSRIRGGTHCKVSGDFWQVSYYAMNFVNEIFAGSGIFKIWEMSQFGHFVRGKNPETWVITEQHKRYYNLIVLVHTVRRWLLVGACSAAHAGLGTESQSHLSSLAFLRPEQQLHNSAHYTGIQHKIVWPSHC